MKTIDLRLMIEQKRIKNNNPSRKDMADAKTKVKADYLRRAKETVDAKEKYSGVGSKYQSKEENDKNKEKWKKKTKNFMNADKFYSANAATDAAARHSRRHPTKESHGFFAEMTEFI